MAAYTVKNRKQRRGGFISLRWFGLTHFIFSAMLAWASVGVHAQPVDTRLADYVMVMVGKAPITHSDYLRAAAQMGVSLPATGVNQQVLDALINEKVVLQAAKGSGIKIGDNELGVAIQNHLRSQNLSQEAFQKQLAEQNRSWERFREGVRESLLVERFRNSELGALAPSASAVTVSSRALNPQKVEVALKLNLGHILVLVPEGIKPAELEKAQAKIQDAHTKLHRGVAFAKVAAAVSDAPEGKLKGGELGLRAVNEYPEFFVAAVQNLKRGQFTSPLRSPVGLHILKRIENQSETAALSTADKYVQTLVRHILLPAKSETELKAANATANQLVVKLKQQGAEFAQLAKEYSQDGSAKNGGIIGWVEPGQLVPEFEGVLHTLPLRTLSAPVVSPYGVHLIEVLERRVVDTAAANTTSNAATSNATTPTLSDAERQKQFEQAVAKWLQNLRSSTYIEYREPPL